jgi:hypothetical protein
MAGLFRNSKGTREGKYLVKRRDGTVPEWPWFVLGAKDPAAPAAIKAYATECAILGMDPKYVSDLIALSHEFERYRLHHGSGDPDAGRERIDDPTTVAEMQGQ